MKLQEVADKFAKLVGVEAEKLDTTFRNRSTNWLGSKLTNLFDAGVLGALVVDRNDAVLPVELVGIDTENGNGVDLFFKVNEPLSMPEIYTDVNRQLFQDGDTVRFPSGEEVTLHFNGIAFVWVYEDGEWVTLYNEDNQIVPNLAECEVVAHGDESFD